MDKTVKSQTTDTTKRAEWVRPVLFRMDAADAENQGAFTGDAANNLMMNS